MTTFMDQLMSGETTIDEFPEYVAAWHAHPTFDGEVYEYLGLTEDEYLRVAVDPQELYAVIAERSRLR